jgi:hypothetical protein
MDFSAYLNFLIVAYTRQRDRSTLTDLQMEYRQEERRSHLVFTSTLKMADGFSICRFLI